MSNPEKNKAAPGAGGQAGIRSDIDQRTYPNYTTSASAPSSISSDPLVVYHLARHLAGASDADMDMLRRGFPNIPLESPTVLRAWLETQPDLLSAVLATDPSAPPRPPQKTAQATQELLADVPELPDEAQLTTSAESDAATVGIWLNDYLDYAVQKSPSTPIRFHEAAGLFAGGLAIARRLRVPMAHADIWPNLYILLVAPTTLYAKTVCMRILADLVDDAMPHLRLSSEFTPEALLADLAGKEPVGLQNESEETRNLWKSARNFAAQRGIILDEASALFAGFKRDYMTGTAELLMRMYDAPKYHVRNTRGSGLVMVRAAALSFLGATTPTSLQRADVSIGWHNGMFARFGLLTPETEPVYALTDTRPDPPATLIETLRRLTNELLPIPTYPDQPSVQDVVIDQEAYAAWQRYDRAVRYDLLVGDNKPDIRLWGCYGRMPTHALKIALILAALDWAMGMLNTPRITMAHWARGQMIAEAWRHSAHRLLRVLAGDDEGREEEERVITLLGRAGDTGITAREAGRALHLARAKVEPILDRLVTDDLAEAFTPAGAKAKRYRLKRYNIASV